MGRAQLVVAGAIPEQVALDAVRRHAEKTIGVS